MGAKNQKDLSSFAVVKKSKKTENKFQYLIYHMELHC